VLQSLASEAHLHCQALLHHLSLSFNGTLAGLCTFLLVIVFILLLLVLQTLVFKHIYIARLSAVCKLSFYKQRHVVVFLCLALYIVIFNSNFRFEKLMFKVQRFWGRDCGGTRKVCMYICLLGSDKKVTEIMQDILRQIEEIHTRLQDLETVVQQLQTASSYSHCQIALGSCEAVTGEFQSDLSFMLLLVMVVAGGVFSHMRKMGAMHYSR
jgi:hypothetical protein